MNQDDEKRQLVARLCEELAGDLRAFIASRPGGSSVVDDVLQRTFLKAVERSAAVCPETARGWLFQIAINELRSLVRSEVRERRRRDFLQELSRSVTQQAGVSASLEHAERQKLIHLALERLPEEQREIVTRRIYQGQTFAVIAAQLDLPPGTVMTRMRLALMKLAQDSDLKNL